MFVSEFNQSRHWLLKYDAKLSYIVVDVYWELLICEEFFMEACKDSDETTFVFHIIIPHINFSAWNLEQFLSYAP